MEAFLGKWNLDKSRSVNQATFAKTLGVNDQVFAVLEKAQITLTISQEGSDYKFETDLHGAAPTTSYVAGLGKPVEVPALDLNKAQLVLSVEGDTLKEVYSRENGSWIVTRTVSGNEMTVVSVVGDVKMSHILVKA